MEMNVWNWLKGAAAAIGGVADFCAAHGSGTALPESLAVTVAAGGQTYNGTIGR